MKRLRISYQEGCDKPFVIDLYLDSHPEDVRHIYCDAEAMVKIAVEFLFPKGER